MLRLKILQAPHAADVVVCLRHLPQPFYQTHHLIWRLSGCVGNKSFVTKLLRAQRPHQATNQCLQGIQVQQVKHLDLIHISQNQDSLLRQLSRLD